MNRLENSFNPLTWFMTLLLAAFVAGCGGGDGGSGSGSGASLTAVTVAPGAGGSATIPTVISSSPINGATNVPTSQNATTGTLVTAIFSQPMDPATINSSPAGTLLTFTLKEASGTNVPGTVVMNAANTVATFTPAASALNTNTSYTATVTTAAKNAGGNAMVNPVAWSFTTGAVATIGQAPVDLGKAGNYAILAKSGVSTVPSSVVTGNVGVSPAARTALTGWSLITEPTDTFFTSAQVVAPGKLYAADNVGGTTSADLGTAVLNMGTAYTDAAGRTATSAATTNVGAGTLTSLTLTPGVYEWGTAVTIPTDLTLNGSATDVWIFKVAGTLNMAAAKNVILSGGALPKNVFWQVSGAVTIGANTRFQGIILGQTGITFGNLASINGRLLAQTAVVLDATTVTQPAP